MVRIYETYDFEDLVSDGTIPAELSDEQKKILYEYLELEEDLSSDNIYDIVCDWLWCNSININY